MSIKLFCSTLSAALNCLAATVYEDFISPFVPKRTSQERISLYLKLLVVAIGVFSTSCVYIVERLGSLLSLTISFAGVTSGPLLGLFSVGMLVPMVNETVRKTIKFNSSVFNIKKLLGSTVWRYYIISNNVLDSYEISMVPFK